MVFFVILLFLSSYLGWALWTIFHYNNVFSTHGAYVSRFDFIKIRVLRGPSGEEGFAILIFWGLYIVTALSAFVKEKYIGRFGLYFLIIFAIISTLIIFYYGIVYILQYPHTVEWKLKFMKDMIRDQAVGIFVILMPFLLSWKITNILFSRLMPVEKVVDQPMI